MEEFKLGPKNPSQEILQVRDLIVHSREVNCAFHKRVGILILTVGRAWPKSQWLPKSGDIQVKRLLAFDSPSSQQPRKASICKREHEMIETFSLN